MAEELMEQELAAAIAELEQRQDAAAEGAGAAGAGAGAAGAAEGAAAAAGAGAAEGAGAAAAAAAAGADAVADATSAAFGDGQVGLGLDVVQIARMQKILERTPSFMKIFSDDERAYCDSKANPAIHYATRFAAKEAVVKALGTGFAEGVGPQDIEVKRTTKGRPYVVLKGGARKIAEAQGVRELPISLSYTHEEAVACAMAITEESERARERRKDPMAELGKRFKEARAILDGPDGGAPAASVDPAE